MLSKIYTIENGVKQGGIVSPVLFCIYILLIYCAWYANRTLVVLLATSFLWEHRLMLTMHCWLPHRELLLICEEYGKKFSIKFNAAKSAWIYFSKGKQPRACFLQFSINGKLIEVVTLAFLYRTT